jgi:predicted nuclease with TOPRIM domain
MLHITRKLRKITKESASLNEVRIELESAVILFNDIIVALESSNSTLLESEMDFIPESSSHLSHEFNQVHSILDQVLVEKISYEDAAKKTLSWRDELLQSIRILAQFQ